MTKQFSVAIVGCGSVGSRLAMALAEQGASRLLLMDNEQLSPENATRHLCSLSEAVKGLKKVTAVKQELLKKFPNVEYISHDDDVLQFLHEGGRDFNDYDILVSCVGHLAVERRLDFAAENKLIEIPIAYLWLEPYSIASHMLIVPPNKAGGYKKYFSGEGEFIFSAVSGGDKFSKREAGCQTSFVPYSAQDSNVFVNEAARILSQQHHEHVLHTWLGELKKAYKLGYRINDHYTDNAPFSVVKRSL